MNAIAAPRTSRSATADRVRRALALPALSLLAMSVQGAAQEQIAAVWKARELSFSYRSSVAIYSCSALRGRVAHILRAVGARDDLEVKVYDCSEFIAPPEARMNDGFPYGRTDRQQLVHVRVRAMMPLEVTPEVLDELKRDKSRRELVSRVTGNPAAKFNDPIMFAAQWQPVSLSRETIGLQPEECELLDQMSATVFRELGVRVVRKGISCDRYRVSHFSPELHVETLLPAPLETGNAQQEPAAGEDDADPSAPAARDDESAEPATDETPE